MHHALHLNERGDPLRYDAYAPTAQSFTVGSVTAWTLGREETLWHIYRHTFCMPVGYEPLRLIWVADLISLVEAWVDVLDWEQVRWQYRAAWNVLPLLEAPNAEVIGVETLVLPASQTSLDTVLRLRQPGGSDYLHLVEWQGYNDPQFLWRLMSYLGWLGQNRAERPILATLLSHAGR